MLFAQRIRKNYSLPLILIFTGFMSGCGSSGGGSSSSNDAAAPAALELDTNTIWFDFPVTDTGMRTKTVVLTTNKSSDTSFLIADDGNTSFFNIGYLVQPSNDTPASIDVTVTGNGSLKAGESLERTLTFSADGFADATLSVNISADIHEIWVSKSPDRSNPRPLDGAVLAGNEYIFVSVNDDIKVANFYYDEPNDGTPYQKEVEIWFDFEQTIESDPALPANPFDTTLEGEGAHYIIVEILNDDGDTKELRSDFTIDNIP